MNTTQNPRPTTIARSGSGFCRRNTAVALLLSTTILACNRDDLTPASPDSAHQTAGIKPGLDSSRTTPEKPGDLIGVYHNTKITWSPTDFQEIQTDAAGTPVQYTTQYQAIQGSDQVRRTTFQFQYNSEQHLNRVDQTIQFGTNAAIKSYILYHYEGNQVARTEEYASSGKRVASRTYQYNANRQLTQIDENLLNSQMTLRKTYQYDNRGNLTVVSDFVRNAQNDGFTLETTTQYDNYDNQKHVENLLTTTPFLPGVTFRKNNYQTKTVRHRDGTILSRETVRYTYNEQGYPTERTLRGPGGSLTSTYSY